MRHVHRIAGTARRRWIRPLGWAALALGTLLGGELRAAEPASSERSNPDLARSIAVTGREAFNAGDYETAVALFRQAYALYPAPTVGLYEARSLEKLGRLIQASDAYERTAELPIDRNAPAQFREAVNAAVEERRLVEARIPRLKLELAGVEPGEPPPRITVNGVPFPPDQYSRPRRLNPGSYHIAAVASANRTFETNAELAPGQHLTLVLDLRAPSHARAFTRRDGTAALGADGRARGRGVPALVYIVGGIGAAGIGTGVVTGLLANSKHSKAEAACPDNQCVAGSEGPELVDSFRSLRTVSTAAYGVGAAGLAASVILWLTMDDEPAGEARALMPWFSADAAGVQGQF